MRVLLLLFVLGVPALATEPLLKELAQYDPTIISKEQKKALWEEAERRAESRYGKKHWKDHVGDVYAEIKLARKSEWLFEVKRRQLAELEAIGAPDHSTATETLCDLYVLLARRSSEMDERRAEIEGEFRKLIIGDPSGTWQYKAGSVTLAKAVESDRILLREYLYHLVALRSGSTRLLAGKKSESSTLYLVRKGLKRKDAHLRARIADLLSRRQETDVDVLLVAASKEKDAGVRAVMVFGLGRLGERAQNAIERITPFVADPDQRVRVAAARALTRLHVPEAVEPLIRQMVKEKGRPLGDFAEALGRLTGETFGAHPGAWSAWWEKNQGEVIGQGLPAPGSKDLENRAMRWKGSGGFYYGIPQISSRVVYILDTSDSMRYVHEGKNRLERSISEIRRAIGNLPPDATFNVIAYNSDITLWSTKGMRPATRANKESAKTFLSELKPMRTTNIYDALREAFALAGAGTRKKKERVKVDTIFLLSDGAPTLPDATPDKPERILVAAEDWNLLGRVTIHTIGIGVDLKFSFLQKLAEDHNGQFVRKKW